MYLRLGTTNKSKDIIQNIVSPIYLHINSYYNNKIICKDNVSLYPEYVKSVVVIILSLFKIIIVLYGYDVITFKISPSRKYGEFVNIV